MPTDAPKPVRPRPVPPPRIPGPNGPFPPAAPPRVAADAPSKPPKDRGPSLKFQCGHELPAGSLTGQPCPACRNRRREEKVREKRAKRDAQSAAAPRPEIGRLPAGSVKRLAWDGAEWSGVLYVPGCPMFECRVGGEAGCFHALDGLYRQYLAGQGQGG